MAITFTGTGGLFTRLGKIGGWIVSLLNAQGSAVLTAPTKSAQTAYQDLLANFVSGSAQSDLFDGFVSGTLNPYRVKPSTIPQLVTLAQNLVLRQANDDTPLKQYTLAYAVQEVIRQMGVSTYFNVTGATVGATTPVQTPGSVNTGTAVVTSSVTGPYLQGSQTAAGAMVLQYVFPETMLLKCTADAYTGGASQWQETFSFQGGNANVADPLAWNFSNVFGATATNGSGCSGTLNVCSPASYQGVGPGGNLLNNGDFAGWSSSISSATLNQFVAVLGAAGTDYELSTAIASPTGGLVATQAIAFLFGGGGATFTQQFGNGAGTAAVLLPNTVYAVDYWAKKIASATGNIIVDLIDGSNNVINDNNAVANSSTVTVASLTTAYTAQSFYFRTPAVLPSIYKIRIRYTSPATANCFMSDLALRAAVPTYSGGPYIAIFRGGVQSLTGDDYNAAFTQNYGGVTNSVGHQWLWNMLFGLRTLGAPPPISNTQPPAGTVGFTQLPITGGTTISDSLVS